MKKWFLFFLIILVGCSPAGEKDSDKTDLIKPQIPNHILLNSKNSEKKFSAIEIIDDVFFTSSNNSVLFWNNEKVKTLQKNLVFEGQYIFAKNELELPNIKTENPIIDEKFFWIDDKKISSGRVIKINENQFTVFLKLNEIKNLPIIFNKNGEILGLVKNFSPKTGFAEVLKINKMIEFWENNMST